ncbi:MAG: hypothetical protein WC156_16885, partial [Pedobacter sp.]
MTTNLEYALMAGGAYISNRPDINKLPVPDDWTKFQYVTKPSGFEAVSFKRGNEIVISFAGTNPEDISGDVAADISLATGFGSVQLLQAAEYYMQVKAVNPNAEITFTGHSLGGGLAALIGVFFNKQAVTFDQAPFWMSTTEWTRDQIKDYLFGLTGTNGQPLYTEQQLAELEPGFVSYSEEADRSGRQANVSGYYVEGEFLTTYPVIGGLAGVGNTTPINHGDTNVSGVDLHSQALLTAFLENDQFRQVTDKLTDLLGMIFDSNLFAHPTNDPDNENFIDRLVRYESGIAPGATDTDMLTRFTADLWKIAQEGGMTLSNKDVAQTLTAFAMQMYYNDDTPADKTLFDSTGITGGIQFDRSDVADVLDAAKGFSLYFQDYLNTLPPNESQAITQQLPNLLDWYMQTGYRSMEATAGDKRAFMLGGDKGDNLFGGTVNDVLVGGKGIDLLLGGKGDDLLIGGEGNDNYYYRIGDGNDRIIDNLGNNKIIIKNENGDVSLEFGTFYTNVIDNW